MFLVPLAMDGASVAMLSLVQPDLGRQGKVIRRVASSAGRPLQHTLDYFQPMS